MDSSGRPWIMEVSCCLAASISGVRPGDTCGARGVVGAGGEGSPGSSFMGASGLSFELGEAPPPDCCSLFTAWKREYVT